MIDRAKLLDLLNGNEGLADQFIQSFKTEVMRQLPLMTGYLAEGDMAMLSNAAHVMKTQTAYVGLDELTKIARYIEIESNGSADLTKLESSLRNLKTGLLKAIDSDTV